MSGRRSHDGERHLSDEERATREERVSSAARYEKYLETLPKKLAAHYRRVGKRLTTKLRFLERTLQLVARREVLQDIVRDTLERHRREPMFPIEHIGTRRAAAFCMFASGVRADELAVVMGVTKQHAKTLQAYFHRAKRNRELADEFPEPEYVVSRADIVEAAREVLEIAVGVDNLDLRCRALELIGHALGLLGGDGDEQ